MSGCWCLRGARRAPHASGKRASDPCPSRRGRPSQWASNLLMFERHGRSSARTICLALVRWHISVSVVGAQARRRLPGPASLSPEANSSLRGGTVAFRMKGDRPQATPTSPSASRTPERFSRGRPPRACVAHVASRRSARPGFGPLWSPALALRSHRPWQKERLGEGELAFYGPECADREFGGEK